MFVQCLLSRLSNAHYGAGWSAQNTTQQASTIRRLPSTVDAQTPITNPVKRRNARQPHYYSYYYHV